jgi:hypothetical protein
MSLTAVVLATTSIATVVTAAIDGEWRPGELSAALVWAGVWVWHRAMRRSAATAPSRLADLTPELSALYGLVVGAVGATAALGALISEAFDVGATLVSSRPWLFAVLQSLVWFAIGALVWWWNWFRERAGRAPGAFASVLLVIVIGAAASATLYALGTVLDMLLRLLVGDGTAADILAPLGVTCATALVGGIVWAFHVRVLASRSNQTRGAARLVVSAIALIGAASGFGVIVNALLATVSPTLAGENSLTLLLAGISALIVSGPTWWFVWRPDRRTTPAQAADSARRVYLVVIFGVSAIAALITLLIIGYRLFEFALGSGSSAGGLIELIRVPLGVLSATVVVFAYHFAVWRRDRATAPKAAKRQIGRIILVTAGDAGGLVTQLRTATEAPVTVWAPADPAAVLTDADLASLLMMLQQISAARVLVVAEPGRGARVIPLVD